MDYLFNHDIESVRNLFRELGFIALLLFDLHYLVSLKPSVFCVLGVSPWRIWRTRGTEESHVSTHSSRRTDTHWLMTKAGESGQILSSTRYDGDTSDLYRD